MKTEYPIIIGGDNFGCGSSREHAPVALGASGERPARCVAAQRGAGGALWQAGCGRAPAPGMWQPGAAGRCSCSCQAQGG